MAAGTMELIDGTASSAPGGRQPQPPRAPDRAILCRRFGEALRRLRLEAGLSLDDLGERCGLHRTEIGLLERAGREPKLSTIVKLAEGLRIPPGDLLTRVDAPFAAKR
jgi:DNA-binding XRE family transcriptional regulator